MTWRGRCHCGTSFPGQGGFSVLVRATAAFDGWWVGHLSHPLWVHSPRIVIIFSDITAGNQRVTVNSCHERLCSQRQKEGEQWVEDYIPPAVMADRLPNVVQEFDALNLNPGRREEFGGLDLCQSWQHYHYASQGCETLVTKKNHMDPLSDIHAFIHSTGLFGGEWMWIY